MADIETNTLRFPLLSGPRVAEAAPNAGTGEAASKAPKAGAGVPPKGKGATAAAPPEAVAPAVGP